MIQEGFQEEAPLSSLAVGRLEIARTGAEPIFSIQEALKDRRRGIEGRKEEKEVRKEGGREEWRQRQRERESYSQS